MTPQKQQKLNDYGETIAERKAYLEQVERDIEAVSNAGNNQLFIIRGEMQELENQKAALLRQNYEIEQAIREKRRILES